MINGLWTSLLAEMRGAGELRLRIGQDAGDCFSSVAPTQDLGSPPMTPPSLLSAAALLLLPGLPATAQHLPAPSQTQPTHPPPQPTGRIMALA